MTEFQPAQRWSAGAARELTIPVGVARTALLQAIRALGFATTSEKYSVLEAERGSKLRGLSLTRTRVPVAVRIAFTPGAAGCSLEIRVEDRWGATGRSRGAVAVYADVFTEVLAGLDESLRRADPAAAASFPYWWRDLPEAEVAAGTSTAGTAARFESVVLRRTSRLLDGPRKGPTTAVAEAGVMTVTFAAPGAVAQIPAEVVDGMLTAGQLIAASPGKMPATLVEQVQAMVVMLEERLAAMARGPMQGDLALHIEPADRPVITFLYQQAALRERLPVRLLMSCTTCRLEKVINPDFVRLRERNRRIKVLSSSVGAVFGTHHISPFILVGRLAQVKKSDPDFVCVRCQGTDADEKPITFCPRCVDRRTDSVLRNCSKCDLDLRTLLPGASVWHPLEAAPPPDPADGQAPPEPVEPVEQVEPVEPVEQVEQIEQIEPVAPVAPVAPVGAPAQASAAPMDDPAPPGGWSVRPGWYSDPWHHAELRYWDGGTWTPHVMTGGSARVDLPVAPEAVAQRAGESAG